MNLKLRYKLHPHDFLQQVLYYNSKSSEAKKQRQKAWLFVIIFIIIVSVLILYLFKDKIEIGHYLGAIPVAILAILMFPYFNKRVLKKQFTKYVQENYQHVFEKASHLTFHKEIIEVYNATGESKINYTSLEKIIEIGSHFFLVLKSGTYLILPKSELENTAT